MTGFRDRYGRRHDELRISVTDRCNLRCSYCMPEEPQWFARQQILSFEEVLRLVRLLVRHGVRRYRITGGEPLLRREVDRLVEGLARTTGVEELSLTTNGLLLAEQAARLAGAGLQRVNVSLDTLDAERFRTLTRRDALARVLEGLAAAEQAGLHPIKINTVLLRGVNDDEIVPLAALARERGWELRFIEFMPLENGNTWDLGRVVRGDEVRATLARRWPLDAVAPADPHAPATRYRYRDGAGTVGFIDSVTRPFCATCSRLRLTADGKLTSCLYAQDETDLKAALRAGASDAALAKLVVGAVARKGRGGALEIVERRAAIPLLRTMHQIGG